MATHAGCNYCRLGKHPQTPLWMHLRRAAFVCPRYTRFMLSPCEREKPLFAACELANTKIHAAIYCYLCIECVWALLDFLLCWADANTRSVVNFESSSFHERIFGLGITSEKCVRRPDGKRVFCSEQWRWDLLLHIVEASVAVKCKYVRTELHLSFCDEMNEWIRIHRV